MGEYARKSNGESVKLGTCESLYYMRAEHMKDLYSFASSDVPKTMARVAECGYRFRFPFPDEDGMRIGDSPGNRNFDRGLPVHGFALPESFKHEGKVFLSNGKGFGKRVYASLPCPVADSESPASIDGAHYEIVAQKPVLTESGHIELWTVVRCVACKSMWRLPAHSAAELAEACLEESGAHNWQEIASRIVAGYIPKVEYVTP